MSKNREVKSNPADSNDKFAITYAQFKANREKTEMRVHGVDRESELLLKSFGFELDSNGNMSIKAIDNDYIRVDENASSNKKNKIARIVNGIVLSKSEIDNDKAERWMEREKARISKNSNKNQNVR